MYRGEISTSKLPDDVFNKIAGHLFGGVKAGYGQVVDLNNFGQPDLVLLNELKSNVYAFSGAKTFSQVKELQALITDGDRVLGFEEFSKKAEPIIGNYNKNWLRAEYNLAVGNGNACAYWLQVEQNKDIMPMLKYVTVGDSRVRRTHKRLDGVVRPVNDKFWDTYAPKNGWNCRCRLKQMEEDEEEVTDLTSFKEPEDVPDLFKYNPGKERIIYPEGHHYYKEATHEARGAISKLPKPHPVTPAELKPAKVEPELGKNRPANLDAWVSGVDQRLFNALDKPINLELDVKPGTMLEGRKVKGAHHRSWSNTVVITNEPDRWGQLEGPLERQNIIYHEVGHAVHTQRGIITHSTISPEFTEVMDSLKKVIKGKCPELIQKFWPMYKQEAPIGVTTQDWRELGTAFYDIIGSLTGGKYGGGHAKKYYKSFNGGAKEVFANGTSYYFNGNPFIDNLAPEIGEIIKKYLDGLYK